MVKIILSQIIIKKDKLAFEKDTENKVKENSKRKNNLRDTQERNNKNISVCNDQKIKVLNHLGNANEKEILKKQIKMSRMRHQERKE